MDTVTQNLFNETLAQAEAGQAAAQFNLGIIHATGHGVQQDYNTAFVWWSKAAEQGLAHAQHNLASLYANGDGVRQDDVLAYKWFKLAAQQHFEMAQQCLNQLTERMSPDQVAKAGLLVCEFQNTSSGLYCPVCEKSSHHFEPFGSPVRLNAACPHCKSFERHRASWLFLKKMTNLFDGRSKMFLHIAPENCFEPRLKAALGTGYITADLNRPNVQVNMDITAIPFADGSFDAIYCSHVLEHVPDDKKAIREFFRVLKPNGWATLLVPLYHNLEKTFEDPSVTDPKERQRLFGQHDHVRKYGKDFPERLRSQGFQVECFHPKDFLSQTQSIKCGIHQTPLYYCTKMP